MPHKADGFATLLFLALLNNGPLYPFSRIPFAHAAAVLCVLDGGRAAWALVCFIAYIIDKYRIPDFLGEKRALHVQKSFH